MRQRAEFIRATTLGDLPRTHGPMLPGAAVQTANGALPPVEQIKRFATAGAWEPAGDEVTPTIKLKRQAIAAKYAQRHRVPVRQGGQGGASRRSRPQWPCQSSRAPAELPHPRQLPIRNEPTQLALTGTAQNQALCVRPAARKARRQPRPSRRPGDPARGPASPRHAL